MSALQTELDYLIAERIGIVTDDPFETPDPEILAMIWEDCLREVGVWND